jgi:hypothetical protein
VIRTLGFVLRELSEKVLWQPEELREFFEAIPPGPCFLAIRIKR